MVRRPGYPSLLAALSFVFAMQLAQAQFVDMGRQSRPRITAGIDEAERVTLKGNTHPDARPENDRGKVNGDFPLQHLLLQLRRSPEQEAAVQQFIDALHNPASPEFHNWITADEFGNRFGVAEQDLDTLTRWLELHGFTINAVYPSGMVIDFSGTAEQVRQAFGTEIHYLNVRGENHLGNMSDPQIPAALAPVVVGVVSLNDFRPRTMHVMRSPQPEYTFAGTYGTTYALVPADLATIYNLNPLFSAGYSGQGQTIALIEDTDIFTSADWTTFRSKLGLSSYSAGSFQTVHPAPPTGLNNCTAPGIVGQNDAEAILDAEWASAAAPSAAVEIAACADTATTFGGLIAVQNLINASNPPAIMSVSYGQCETENGAAGNAAFNSVYQQAVAEGVSIFAAAGDSGASGCDNGVAEATHGIGANAFASTPYNVAVGGTDFGDTYAGTNSTYWSTTNSSTFGSAKSYIPEIPWNDSCASALLAGYQGFASTYGSGSLCNSPLGSSSQTTVAGGGSPSGCATGAASTPGVVSGTCQGWPKPSWQSVFGNPNDGVRDTPDVSLFASNGVWSHYYVFCWSDTANGGAACTGNPSTWSGAGGTSFSSPIMAGIQALVNQKMNARQGNPNPVYYQLAAAEYGSSGSTSCNSSLGASVASNCVFYDVTQGDMDVNCMGAYNCYDPSGAQGVLSTSDSSFQPAYGTTPGWDFATGIGSVNAANLASNWPGGGPISSFSLSSSPGSLTITQGASGTSTITVVPQNGFSSSVSLAASGLPSGVTATFSPASATTTSTLTLTASATAAIGSANVTVTGTSGYQSSSTTIALAVNSPGNFTLSASPSTLSFYQTAGGTSTITVTPQNGFDGSVSLSVTGLPSGVSASFNPSSTTGTSTLSLSANIAAATGSFTLTINGVSGSLTGTASINLTILSAALPAGWSDLDIGAVGSAGNATFANGTYTVNSSGQYVWNTADGFNFAYIPWTGNVVFVARMVSMQGGGSSQSTGIMIRETLTPGSTNVYATFSSSSLIYFDDRPSTGGNTVSENNGAAVALPYWVKVTRSGNTFTGYASADGVNWVQVGASQTVNMAANVYVGLAVASDNTSRVATATFDNVGISAPPAGFTLGAAPSSVSIAQGGSGTSVITVTPQNGFNGSVSLTAAGLPSGVTATFNPSSTTGTSTLTLTAGSAAAPGNFTVTITGVSGSLTANTSVGLTIAGSLPSGWSDLDIGAVGSAGSATFANGTYTVNSSGQYVWNTADGFNFAYIPWTGNVVFVARMVSMQGGGSSESTGIMIRETLTPGSTNVYTTFSSSSLIYFDDRPSTGGNTVSENNGAAVALPYWVKVTRSGNTFTGYASADGVNWVQVGASQTVNMAANVYVGLAVASDNTARVATATFDNVGISAPPAGFTLGAAPGSVSIAQGGSGTSVITVTPQNGFSGSVSLTAAGLPSGVTATFNPSSTTGTSTLTFTATSAATTGTATVTISGSSGIVTSTTTLTLTVTAVGSPTLPAGWSNSDVGTVGVAGSSNYSNGTFTVEGSGAEIWGNADSFQFAYQSLSGDGTIIARVLGLKGGAMTQSAGLMVRETLTAGSTNVYVALGQQSLIYFDERATTGSSTSSQDNTSAVTPPVWLKLMRTGNTFSGYLSPDGVHWTQVGTNQTVSMAANVYIGLAVNSASNSVLATATFDNVSVGPNAPSSLPAPWLNQDVGPVSLTGSASFSNGTFTLTGSGAEIWGTADSFQFAYQPLSGDGSIVARLVSLKGGAATQSAGLMVRETLTAGSTNAYIALGQQSLIYFDERATTNGVTDSQDDTTAVAAPIWLKLVRSGNTFSGYLSSDGVNWTQVGTIQTVDMAANVYIGLAVNSASSSALATATFDNVAVTP